MLPFWFLKATAPFISEPLSALFSLSLRNGFVPQQWKTAVICPVPKVQRPVSDADFRPVSLTPILSRVLEKFIVRKEFYPLLNCPENKPKFSDQFAFRPTGSTTSALIHILHLVSNLLQDNPYVHIIALDFSKAFDSLSHPPLLQVLSSLGLNDTAYNWLVNFLSSRNHVTKFEGDMSEISAINASVIQGSAVGPFCFIASASGLRPQDTGNEMGKYADDCFLIVPAKNSNSIQTELANVNCWAASNNLVLNIKKTQELIVYKSKHTMKDIPDPIAGVARVKQLNILGVTVDGMLTFSEHVSMKVSQAHQQLYALKALKTHGLHGAALHNVCRTVFLPTITYASQAWWGFVSAADKHKLSSLVHKVKRWELDGGLALPELDEECLKLDRTLFSNILSNEDHVLHQLLPHIKIGLSSYNLRKQSHNRTLPLCTALTSRNFINRMLFNY